MRKVTFDELLGLSAYEAIRDRFRDRMIVHKRARRIFLGPEMSLLFEDHDSVLLQIQEMLRAERISDAKAIEFEMETYNELVPADDALAATLMIEEPERDAREAKRRDYLGFDRALFLEIGSERIQGKFAPEGLFEDRIAVVQFVQFQLGENGATRLLDFSKPAQIISTHPKYQHSIALSESTRTSLATDLDPRNAERARRG